METKQNLITMTIAWFMLLVPFNMIAQPDTNATTKLEKIKAQKVAYITQQLDLTVKESQDFWPLYNEYDANKESLNKTFHKSMKTFKKTTMTDAQADSIIVAEISHEQALLDLKKSYISKFKAVIPATKVAKLAEAEVGFKRMLLKLVKEQRKEGGQKKFRK